MSGQKWVNLPTLLFEVPLYAEVDLSDAWKLPEGGLDTPRLFLLNSAPPFDGYCPYCKKGTTFNRLGSTASYTTTQGVTSSALLAMMKAPLQYSIVCARDARHVMRFYFEGRGVTITKVGQHPSMADIAVAGVQEYAKVLPAQDMGEFKRAVGLAAHGVGIGSFVYLRRIFERIITRRFNEHKDAEGWSEPDFQRKRMDEKIEQLKAYLPEFLVVNRKTYGILSAGIHELSEDVCLAMFRVVKASLMIMLEEDEEKRKKDAMKKSVEAELNSINELLAKTKGETTA